MFQKHAEEVSFFEAQGYSVVRESTHINVKTAIMRNGKTGFIAVIQSTMVLPGDERFHSVVLTATELGFLKELS